MLPPPPGEYHGIYLQIGEESYFKVGARFAEGGGEDGSPFSSIYIYAPDSRRLLDHSGSGKVQSSSPSKPSPSGFPLWGFRSQSWASRTKMAPAETSDVIMTLVSYFCGLPGVRPVNIATIGKVPPQTHNLPKQCDATLCWCKCAGNVRDNSPVLIYRYWISTAEPLIPNKKKIFKLITQCIRSYSNISLMVWYLREFPFKKYSQLVDTNEWCTNKSGSPTPNQSPHNKTRSVDFHHFIDRYVCFWLETSGLLYKVPWIPAHKKHF